MTIVGTLPQLSRWTMLKLAATALQAAITGWEPGCIIVDGMPLPARRRTRDGRVEFMGILSDQWKSADKLTGRFFSSLSLMLAGCREDA